MEYKPALGEPYRPVLSPPRRLSSLLPEWSKSGCIIPAALFNGVDPPRALRPAEILTPRVTQVLPTASVAAAAAPASGIRANGPGKTPNPSTGGHKGASTPSDPDTRESGSEVSDPSISGPSDSDPSSLDPKQEDPKKTDPKADDSAEPKIDTPNLNSADPQDVRPGTSDPETTPAEAGEASDPKPPNPEIVDPKNAGLPPSDSQDIDPQALDGQSKPEEAQDPPSEFSNLDDPKAGIPSPNHSQPKVSDTHSDSADLSSEHSGDPPPEPSDDHTPSVTDSSGNDVPSSSPQVEKVTDPHTNNLSPFIGASKHSSSPEQNYAASDPNESPVTEPEATNGDVSDVKSPDVALDTFDALAAKLFNIHKALPQSAKSGDGQQSKPNDPERDPSSRPQNPEFPPPGDIQNDGEAIVNDILFPQESANFLSTVDSGIIADLPSKTTFGDDSSLSLQHYAHGISTAGSYATGDSPSKTTALDNSASVIVTIGISEQSRSALSSAILAADGVSKNSVSVLSSASAAASGLHPGSDGTSVSKDGGEKGNSAASSEAKSSGNSLLISRRHPGSNVPISARELLYGICTYVLPSLLTLL